MASYTRMIWLTAGALFTGAAFSATHAADQAAAPALENSVVKIFSTMRYPDPFKPWTKQAPSEATASGVVIEGKRILTNAHAVLYASQVQMGRRQGVGVRARHCSRHRPGGVAAR